MAACMIRSRIDPKVKDEANRVFHEMGLTMSDAIRIFLYRVVAEKAIPFPVAVPNAETIAAMAAADRGEGEPTTIEQIVQDWNEAACAK